MPNKRRSHGNLSRRRFIATSATAGSVIALAGCAATGDGGDGDGGDGDGGDGSDGDGGGDGGSSGDGSTTELVYWHQEGVPHRQEQFEQFTQQFNEDQDDVQVRVEPQNWNEVFGKLTSALDAGNEPDFMFSLPSFTMTFQARDALVDVTDIVEEVDSEHDVFDNTITPYQYQGGTWGIPMWDMVFLNHYRTDTLGQTSSWPPENWEEWLQASTEATSGDRHGIVLPANKNLWTTENLYTLMINNDSYVYGPDGGIMFDTQETVETLDFYKQMFEQASPSGATGWGWAEWERSLLQGSAHSTIGFSSWIRRLEDTDHTDSWDAVEQPHPSDGQRGSVHYVNNIMVFNEGEKDAIGQFVKYLHSEEVYGDWLASTEPTLYLPVTDTGQNSSDFWNHELISKHEGMVQKQFEALPHSKLYGFRDIHVENDLYIPSLGTLEGSSALAEVVQELIVNDRSPEEAASWGQDRLQEVLEVDASSEL